MKHLALSLALLLAGAFAACGGGSGSSSVSPTNSGTGTWSETLVSSSSQQLGSFQFDLSQNGTTLTGSSVNLNSMGTLSSCFGAGTVIGGQMGSGMMNGGTMNMTMSWTQGGSTNTLSMQGAMANGMGSGSGTFTLTGQTSGCTTQSGTFNMAHTSTSMM